MNRKTLLHLLLVAVVLVAIQAIGAQKPTLNPPEIDRLALELEQGWPLTRIHEAMRTNSPVPFGFQMPVIRDVWLGELHRTNSPGLHVQWQLEQAPMSNAVCMIRARSGSNVWIIAYGKVSHVRNGIGGLDESGDQSQSWAISKNLEKAWPVERISREAESSQAAERKDIDSLLASFPEGGLLHPGRELGFDLIRWRLGTALEGQRECMIIASRGMSQWIIVRGKLSEVVASGLEPKN